MNRKNKTKRKSVIKEQTMANILLIKWNNYLEYIKSAIILWNFGSKQNTAQSQIIKYFWASYGTLSICGSGMGETNTVLNEIKEESNINNMAHKNKSISSWLMKKKELNKNILITQITSLKF